MFVDGPGRRTWVSPFCDCLTTCPKSLPGNEIMHKDVPSRRILTAFSQQRIPGPVACRRRRFGCKRRYSIRRNNLYKTALISAFHIRTYNCECSYKNSAGGQVPAPKAKRPVHAKAASK